MLTKTINLLPSETSKHSLTFRLRQYRVVLPVKLSGGEDAVR
jgi:hypothetical protein